MAKRKCAICGNPLGPKQKLYCCRECFYKSLKAETKYAICKYCGKEFPVKYYNQRFCNKSCASTRNNGRRIDTADRDRPFTKDTRYLIRLWFSQGDSKEKIAEALGRSLENIELAFK